MPSKLLKKPAKKNRDWKVAGYTQNSPSKNIKFALLILFILIGILFFGQLFNFTKTLFSPWTDKKENISRKYSWDGEFNINVVLHNKYISVLSYNPKEKSITLIPLPDNIYLDVSSNLGKWQLGSVFNLGQSLPLGSENLLARTVSSFLGIPIEGYIQLKGGLKDIQVSNLVDSLKKGPFNIFSIISDFKSDLTLWELIKLKLALSSVRFDKVNIVDLQVLKILLEEKLPDGSPVLVADSVRMDGNSTYFSDSQIRQEGLTIAISNGTSHPLLAQKAARIVTNLGGNVIITSNTDQKFDKTYVTGKDSKTLARLAQIFNSNCKKAPDCGKIEPKIITELSASRAQINIILGEDFYNSI